MMYPPHRPPPNRGDAMLMKIALIGLGLLGVVAVVAVLVTAPKRKAAKRDADRKSKERAAEADDERAEAREKLSKAYATLLDGRGIVVSEDPTCQRFTCAEVETGKVRARRAEVKGEPARIQLFLNKPLDVDDLADAEDYVQLPCKGPDAFFFKRGPLKGRILIHPADTHSHIATREYMRLDTEHGYAPVFAMCVLDETR